MRKPLTSLLMSTTALLAGGSGQAQTSSAQVYGVIDLSATSRQLSGNVRTKEVLNGAMTTSFIGVRGNEDLGGGWGALFDMESFLRADSGDAGRAPNDSFWARSAWVGLSSPMATVRLGRQSTPSFLLAGRTNPFGFATGVGPFMMHTYMPSATQPMLTGSGASDSAWPNSVSVVSRELQGVTVSLLGSAGEGTAAGRRWSAAANYSAGPLAGGLSVERLSKMNQSWGAPAPVLATAARPLFTATEVQTVLAGLSYDFGPVMGYAQLFRAELDAASGSSITLKTSQLGASVPLGVAKVLASWVHTTKDQAPAVNFKRDTVALAYDHWLSKRTDAYAVLLHDKVTGLSSGNSFGLGLRHSF
jgi:predicted porin